MMAGMICGGWDPYNGGQVFEIPLGGTIMPQRFAIGMLCFFASILEHVLIHVRFDV